MKPPEEIKVDIDDMLSEWRADGVPQKWVDNVSALQQQIEELGKDKREMAQANISMQKEREQLEAFKAKVLGCAVHNIPLPTQPEAEKDRRPIENNS